jgi:hypothetical protein
LYDVDITGTVFCEYVNTIRYVVVMYQISSIGQDINPVITVITYAVAYWKSGYLVIQYLVAYWNSERR